MMLENNEQNWRGPVSIYSNFAEWQKQNIMWRNSIVKQTVEGGTKWIERPNEHMARSSEAGHWRVSDDQRG